MCIDMIRNNREAILIGEIGALLHDIGKLHPDFIKSKSIENMARDIHAQIDKFVNPGLLSLIKNSKFKIEIGGKVTDIYKLITEHHNKNENQLDEIVKILKRCDQKDSADDKGIVRKKQSIENTIISSPFGYPKEKIDLNCLQKRFEDLEDNLTGLFKDYISGTMNLSCFRKSLINNLETTFSHTLGETRIPANDVTLWDHSYSTASLFKTALAAKACGVSSNFGNLKWGIFGICWNGLEFINKGRKIAEIQARNEIIENIKKELRRKFEDEIPIGNVIYEDTNGIYFTFPDLDVFEIEYSKELKKGVVPSEIITQFAKVGYNLLGEENIKEDTINKRWFILDKNNNKKYLIVKSDRKNYIVRSISPRKSKYLAKECAEEGLEIIYRESNTELWPFFTLSKASGTLTIIANELKFASEKRRIPKMSPTLFIENEDDSVNFENPEFTNSIHVKENQDICPICKIRPKDKEKERCDTCEKRRRGRLIQWLSSKQDTIWIDEVADKNNRIALISVNFYLDKWLDGAMIGTIYSQSFEDWLNKERENLSIVQDKLKEKIKEQIEHLEEVIEKMKKAKDQTKVKDKINRKIEEKKELEQKIRSLTFAFILVPKKRAAYKVLDVFFEVKNDDREIAADILNTFFEENIGLNKNSLEKHLTDIKERIGPDNLTKRNLATYFFTQNPSPARLYRIWQETEEFFDIVIREIKDKIYNIKWKRIRFSINYTDLESKLKQGKKLEGKTPYIIQIDNLEPQQLLIFHNENGEFYTIESLEKFKFNNKMGEEALKEALKQGFKYLTPEDEPSENLLKDDQSIMPNGTTTEEYYPLIEINKSPLSLRLMVPALDSIKIIELVTKFYNERFEKVIGKLPLNVKLLVTKRKFPLYILLDAENRMLEEGEFKKQIALNPWWDVNGRRNDKYYGFYPTKIKENEKYILDDLSSISKGKIFCLYPGYFDFDLLLGTTDRYNIYYKDGKRGREDYKLFTGRPYYFYQISEILELWDVLSNLSITQVNFIEETLTSKLRKWRSVDDGNRQNVFKKFAEATLKDAFGGKWNELREETRCSLVCSAINGILLDTIILFRHIIKAGGIDEYE